MRNYSKVCINQDLLQNMGIRLVEGDGAQQSQWDSYVVVSLLLMIYYIVQILQWCKFKVCWHVPVG